MSHEPESEYEEKVLHALRDAYGEDNVHSQETLDSTGRRADIVVTQPGSTEARLVAEVENDWEACLKGAGQVILYSKELGCPGYIFVPPHHVETPEILYLERASDFTIVQFPVPEA